MKKTFHYDLFILFIIIAVIIGLFFMNSQDTGHYVKINYHKKNYGIYNLNENQIININDENILIIKNQEIYMSKATCPDKTCIKQGNAQRVNKWRANKATTMRNAQIRQQYKLK